MPTGIPQYATMTNVLHPSLFLPIIRPSSSPPTTTPRTSDGAVPTDRAPRSLTKQSPSGLKTRRTSPPRSMSRSQLEVATVTHHGSYSISRAISQPVSPRYCLRLPQAEAPHSSRPRTRVRITYCSISRSFSGIMPLVISILTGRQRVECITK